LKQPAQVLVARQALRQQDTKQILVSRYSCPSHSVATIVEESGITSEIIGASDVLISGITQDSRSVQQGDLFCCVRGQLADGHTFAGQAIQSGASALLVDVVQPHVPAHVTQIVVSSVRDVLGNIASATFGHPSRTLRMTGITGTNGKTSTAYILGEILKASGAKVLVVGTLTGERTTPEAIDLQHQLRTCVDQGGTHAVMEVSSHGLVMGRVNGILFDVAVFTNLGRDHLDFHGSYENYFAAKAQLFTPALSRHAIINSDDKYGQLLIDVCELDVSTFGRIEATDVRVGVGSLDFEWRSLAVHLSLGGDFSLYNALAAMSAARVLGVPDEVIVRGCAEIAGVPGRFQSVPNDQGIGVIVDYAHTPESLEGVIESVRQLTKDRVLVVFGCGGDRDVGKRSVMGDIASQLSDVVYVTSDNPRSEDPSVIIEEIMKGTKNNTAIVHVCVDRAHAIRDAIAEAQIGDIVVIAGKGHESTQETRGVIRPFDDFEVARVALLSRRNKDR
jgi:UDP-N-acetylmuramoyl-L-alanyl-D-glutamate--2,6-diaminopimelate ligase